jgi:hypothetical protein
MTIVEYTRNRWAAQAASQLLDKQGVSNDVGRGLPHGTVRDDLHRFIVFASSIHPEKQRSDFYKRHKISALLNVSYLGMCESNERHHAGYQAQSQRIVMGGHAAGPGGLKEPEDHLSITDHPVLFQKQSVFW